MSANEYILGLMAIVSGLAITEWIGSLYRLLAARRAVRWDWLAALAAAFSAYMIVNSWWISWRSFGPETNLSLGRMIWNLTEIVLLFLAARAALPESVPQEGVVLRDHYDQNNWLVWGPITLSGLMLVSTNLLYDWHRAFFPGMIAIEAGAAVGLVLTLVQRRAVHAVLAPLIALGYVAATIGERMSGS